MPAPRFLPLPRRCEILTKQAERIKRFEDFVPKLIEAYQSSDLDLTSWVRGPMQGLVERALESENYSKEVYRNLGITLTYEGVGESVDGRFEIDQEVEEDCAQKSGEGSDIDDY